MTTGELAALDQQESGGKVKAASPFRVLRYPNYRLLWLGTLVSSSGDWMDQIALNWLVLLLTNSPIYLGILNLCRSGPILVFTLLGGAVADRVERRRLMIVTQTGAMFTAVGLAIVAQTGGGDEIWVVLGLATLRGILLSFNLPARQALISELVPREDLMGAISLNSATLNVARIIGPSIGGVLIIFVGVSGAFYLNAASFLAVIYALFRMKLMPLPTNLEKEPVWKSVSGGIRLVAGDKNLRSLLFVALAPLVLGMSYMPMLAVFAKDVLQSGSIGLGVLTSAAGLGAVIGALGIGSLTTTSVPRGRIMFVGVLVFGSGLLFFALSGNLWLSAAMLLVLGVGSSMYQAVNNSLLQENAPDEMRGRVMSMLFLARGLIPLGAVVAGFGSEQFGAPATMTVFGILLLLMGGLAAVVSPTVREMP